MLIVQKYGGTSVGNPERIKNVAKRVVRTREQGHDVVVVVSAMAGETDRLIGLAQKMAERPDERELDVILATGVPYFDLSLQHVSKPLLRRMRRWCS